ncbi:unnamed protein product [Sphagnum jensenii]
MKLAFCVLLAVTIAGVKGDTHAQGNGRDALSLADPLGAEGPDVARSKRTVNPLDYLDRFHQIVGQCYIPDHQRTCNRMCQETQKDGGGSCFCGGRCRCGWYRWRRECRCFGNNCHCREFR